MRKEEAEKKITKLVEKYKTLDEKEIKSYNEANTRRNFIELLFAELGWSVYDKKEVSEEERASKGRVDYAFKLNGISQFYLEAKALKENLNKEEYVQQAVEYAYNKGVTWAILSNFEATHVYVAQTNKLCLNLQAANYVERFDDLWLLSRESFEANVIAEWGVRYGHLPGKQRIEDRLFQQLKQWRDALFKQIHHYNKQLTHSEINEVIQRFFNRLIFIRNCEDRKIENNKLRATLNEWRTSGCKGELIEKLQRVFHYFADPYDSDLFEPHLTDSIYIESATVEDIINGLYKVPGSIANYDFSIMEPDVLGSVYEQYLGYVTSLRKKNFEEQQKVTKKHRKEQGIYYTPAFVTNYIVKETVAHFLKDHTHNEVLNMKILDPACGSGSFLIRAFDELLNYHAGVRSKPVVELDQHERLRILLANIFGVDLDKQAVEIARLNLLLRTLTERGELEMLENNIQRGNSLISGTEEELKNYFGKNWKDKEPFNWEDKFPNIMSNGGFDVVLGNPPWAFTKYVDWSDETKKYVQEHYIAGCVTDAKNLAKQSGKINMFAIFILKGMSLLKKGGLFGFIVPNNILRTTVYGDIRRKILSAYSIERIVSLGPGVFSGVTASTVILLLKNEVPPKNHQIEVVDATLPNSLQGRISNHVRQAECLENPSYVIDIFTNSGLKTIFDKMDEKSVKLGALVEVLNGIATHKDKLGIIDVRKDSNSKPILFGRDVARYSYSWSGKYIDYVRSKLLRPRDEEIFLEPEKLIMQRIGGILVTAYDNQRFYTFNSINNLIQKAEHKYSLKYLLGILNSKLMRSYYENKFANRSTLTVNISKTFLDELPVRQIDSADPAERKAHDKLVSLVEKMLELNNELQQAQEGLDKWHDIQKQIEQTDKEIDTLVYNLYGLTEAERRIVESPAM